jgi:hypothetical protein
VYLSFWLSCLVSDGTARASDAFQKKKKKKEEKKKRRERKEKIRESKGLLSSATALVCNVRFFFFLLP